MNSWLRFRPNLLPLLLIVVATTVVYAGILGHDFLVTWDDNFYVTENPDSWGFSWQNIRAAFSSFYIGNYAPVQILSYMFDYSFWGLNPFGYLLTNICVHILNGLLLYRLLSQWHNDRVLALFATAVFLLHPVQVESVAWISQRKNLLALFFLLLAWEAYCRYRNAQPTQRRLIYLASVVAFVCSLLAKSMTVVFPLMLVMHEVCFHQPDGKKRYLDKLPYVLAAVAVGFMAIYSERPDIGSGGRTGFHGGSLWATFLTMLPVFCKYLKMLFWPFGLTAEYAPTIYTTVAGEVVFAGILLAITAICGFLLFRYDRRLGYWICFFWVGLLPLSQIVPMLSLINDRYLYISIIGVAAFGGGAFSRLSRLHDGRFATLAAVAAMVLLCGLAAISYSQTLIWRDSISLFKDVVQKTPASDRGWALLADAYRMAGDVESVKKTYESALIVNPVSPIALSGLGNFLTEQGDLEAGNRILLQLLQVKPDHATGWLILGDNRLRRKDYTGADQAYKRSLEIQPGAFIVYLHLGSLELQRGNTGLARNYFNKVAVRDPYNSVLAYQLACLEALDGRNDEALFWLNNAFQRGFRGYAELGNSEFLKNLSNDPRFAMLIQQYFSQEGLK
ncbi:MAG: tetratricopeptide repeat protein [Geobacteraceae bacterium]|nr:tetratricopeptide repeat protein [Geobacteraceae bacterium]